MKIGREPPPNREKVKDRLSYGPYPANYEDLIKKFLSTRLSDPDSAVYRFGTLHKHLVLLGGSLEPATAGYVVDVGVKVRNPSGDYGSEQAYICFIKNDTVRLIEGFRVKGHPYV